MPEFVRQDFGCFLCFRNTRPDAGYINVKINMGIACGKMPRNCMQCQKIAFF